MAELYAYIDESGILQKQNNPYHQYFIISIVLTQQPKELARVFKRSLLKSLKESPNLLEKLKTNKEIKGSELSEPQKSKIYSDLHSTHIDSEYGIIVVDSLKVDDKFKDNSARAFNYLLKLYLKNYMKSNNKYTHATKVRLFIDERNTATKSINTLKEYLNTELVMADEIFQDDFELQYCDSKNMPLVQLADFIANTTLRYYRGENESANANISILMPLITNHKFFMFTKGK